MKFIVGLGNPGRAYDGTPHNIGFDIVDAMARQAGEKFRGSWRFPLESATIRIDAEEVLLVKPTTFMNRSGEAVAPLMRKKGVTAMDVLVIVDDVELPLGAVRLRERGSAGTHNGLKSLLERIGSDGFPRLRVGFGPVPPGRDRVVFVLGRHAPDRMEKVTEMIGVSAEAARMWVAEGAAKTMNKFNVRQ